MNDLDGWERMSMFEGRIKTLVSSAVDLRPIRVAWRLLEPVIDPDAKPSWYWLALQGQAIRLAGPDPDDPLRNPDYFKARGRASVDDPFGNLAEG